MTFFSDLEHIISFQYASRTLADVLAEQGCPSTAIAILDHGDIITRCISTIGDDDETVFQACSISKPVSGMATMKLVQQGRIQIEDKVVDILPQPIVELLETHQSKHLVAQITVKHLLSHTSGLSVHGFPGYGESPPDARTVLSGNKPVNTRRVCLEGLPGHNFSYSGGGLTVLQIILENITGMDFPSLVRELVFRPLRMSRSFYYLPNGEVNVARAHYTGFTVCEDESRINPEQAAAGLWTTPTDLLKVVRALQQSLESPDGTGFLKQDVARQMLSEVSSGMALTWFAPRDPGVAFGHGGSNEPGWRCFVVGYANLLFNGRGKADPKHDDTPKHCGICVMTNSAAGDNVLWKVVNAIAYLKLWPQVTHIYGYPNATIPFAALDANVDARWRDWIGRWSDEWDIQSDREGLPMVRYGNLPLVRLVPAAIPSIKHSEGQSIDLLVDGLEMMMRLGWKKENRVVELWQGGSGEIAVLERPSGDFPSGNTEGNE